MSIASDYSSEVTQTPRMTPERQNKRTSQRKIISGDWSDRTLANQVDPRLFSQNHNHSHLRRSVRSRELLTLPQNSIGRLRGDVRPDTAQSGLIPERALFPVIFAGLYRST
ncbi:hypothetical protein CDL15_Pgr008076 [Punica granatum]|uniref:Uncharacterized protein n=1 Tax=Punica granatum TaxID=22663 RepID=A0A218WMP9_PUNGR|nr:hypothetical protein CDL15_Pgr008076 [Punica granatum]